VEFLANMIARLAREGRLNGFEVDGDKFRAEYYCHVVRGAEKDQKRLDSASMRIRGCYLAVL
jgi:hypothetical protein